MRQKKPKSAVSEERAYQAEKSQANRSAWQEYAIMWGADYLAAEWVNKSGAGFRGKQPTYKAYTAKGRFHFHLAEITKEKLLSVGWYAHDRKTGKPTPQSLDITETSVRQMLLRRRKMFEAALQDRIKAVERARDAPNPDADDELKWPDWLDN